MIITNETNDKTLRNALAKLGKASTRIDICVAFFTNHNLVKRWVLQNKQINLCVSLRPPTDPNALQQIFTDCKTLKYLGSAFHSKIYVFYKNNTPFAAILGSSNFTDGGLHKNIETNFITEDSDVLTEIVAEVKRIQGLANDLQPNDIHIYKKAFAEANKHHIAATRAFSRFKVRKSSRDNQRLNDTAITSEASEYLIFWKAIDEIAKLVAPISQEQWPEIPVYLTIDHFWHWLTKERYPDLKPIEQSSSWRKKNVPKLFREFVTWDNGGTAEFASRSKMYYRILGTSEKVLSLNKSDAETIYANLNSGHVRARRFGADAAFVAENTLINLRKALNYLLHGTDDITNRITALVLRQNQGGLRLNQLGPANVQELIGWVHPNEFPMKNNKATTGARILGFTALKPATDEARRNLHNY